MIIMTESEEESTTEESETVTYLPWSNTTEFKKTPTAEETTYLPKSGTTVHKKAQTVKGESK